MNIAIICSGGDAAGMNPAIKSFVDNCLYKDIEPYFIYDGFDGLIDGNIKKAFYEDVVGITHLGGTIIRTSRSQRFYEPKFRQMAYDNLKKHDIKKVIVLAGDGSFKGLDIFAKEFDLSFVGIPTTIDNDIYGTDYCLGVDTSLNVIKSALDDIRDTSSSFQRAFVVEVMGRECGYLALVTALTNGAEVCVIPEVECDLISIEKRLQKELDNGRGYILAIVSEGANKTQEIKTLFEENLKIETRVVTLGHVQRGGNPTVFDRLMATKFITKSIDKLMSQENINSVITYKNSQIDFMDIFLLYCLMKDSPVISEAECRDLDQNFDLVVNEGRKPKLVLQNESQKVLLSDWSKALLTDMQGIAEILDEDQEDNRYQAALLEQSHKVQNTELCPSAQILNIMHEESLSWLEFAGELSSKHNAILSRKTQTSESLDTRFEELAKKSFAAEQDIKHADTLSFKTFMKDYQSE